MIWEKDRKLLYHKRLFLFDIDGTLALGDDLLEGSLELIELLRKMNRKIFLTTNNSTKSRSEYRDFFAERGIEIDLNEIVTAGELSLLFCKEYFPRCRIFFIGTPELKREFEQAGLSVTERYEESVDCVFVAFDTTLRFQKLEDASRILSSGEVPYLAANPDLCCPTAFGAVPDCGSICDMLRNATGREPKFLGKPYPDIVNVCRKFAGISAKETVLIGDRIYTDMVCAENAGVDSVLVLSGESDRKAALDCGLQIPYVFESVRSLYELLQMGSCQ